MRLTQPFLGWQLAIVALVGFPAILHAQSMDEVTRVQALERGDFPRSVVLVGALPDSIDSDTWEREIGASLDAWNDVACSYALLEYGGRIDSIAAAPADATTVAFVDGAADRCFVIDNNVGWTVSAPCDDWGPTAVLLNTNGYSWSAAPAPYQGRDDAIVDVRSVLTHELGHVLGLHHADVTDPLATMSARYLPDGGLATLAIQDKHALCALYPQDAGECDGSVDCEGVPCVIDDAAPLGLCRDLRVAIGDYCDLADVNCGWDEETLGAPPGARCLVTSQSTFSGYCTRACTGAADCPADMDCETTSMECRYTPVPLVNEGCTTARGGETWWMLFVMLGLTGWRRSRASSRSRPDTCRDRQRRTWRRPTTHRYRS